MGTHRLPRPAPGGREWTPTEKPAPLAGFRLVQTGVDTHAGVDWRGGQPEESAEAYPCSLLKRPHYPFGAAAWDGNAGRIPGEMNPEPELRRCVRPLCL